MSSLSRKIKRYKDNIYKKPEYLFHGGCHGCTQQEHHGVEFCVKCQYFEPNWDLPNYNNLPPSRTDFKRVELTFMPIKTIYKQ